MEIVAYVRKPYEVVAVQVEFNNAEDIAEWCGGRVGKTKVKLMGREAYLPSVTITGSGMFKNKEFTAQMGDWIIERRGTFRTATDKQFKSEFEEAYVEKNVQLPLLEVTEGLELVGVGPTDKPLPGMTMQAVENFQIGDWVRVVSKYNLYNNTGFVEGVDGVQIRVRFGDDEQLSFMADELEPFVPSGTTNE